MLDCLAKKVNRMYKELVQAALLALCLLGLAAAQDGPGRVADENENMSVFAELSLTPGEDGTVKVESIIKADALGNGTEDLVSEANTSVNLEVVGKDGRRQPLLEGLGNIFLANGEARIFGTNLTDGNNSTVDGVEMTLRVQPPGEEEPFELFISQRFPQGFGSLLA